MKIESIPMLERDKTAYLAYRDYLLDLDHHGAKLTPLGAPIYQELAHISERLSAIQTELSKSSN